MCAEFIKHLPPGWTAYPETWGDILLVRSDGVQIGIEAKLSLNANVISQIAEDAWSGHQPGPDFRAVLVPFGKAGSLASVCRLIGLTVIQMHAPEDQTYGMGRFRPALPELAKDYWGLHSDWWDNAPDARVPVPEYVPDVAAGSAAPVQLTSWKIKAIKIAVLVERRGYVTRADFKALRIDHRLWLAPGSRWLEHGDVRGHYVRGQRFPDFRAQHPVNYEQIAADYERWSPTNVDAVPTRQGSLV